MIEKMKSVCVVAQDTHKEELLTSLRNMGILHLAEKKSANAEIIERLSLISKLMLELKDYVTEEEEVSQSLSDQEFEALCQKSIWALDRKSVLNTKITQLRLEIDRLKPWGEFDSDLIGELSKKLELHFYRVDKNGYKKILQDEDIKFIHLKGVEGMEAIATFKELDTSFGGIEFTPPKKGPAQLEKELSECEAELLECDKILKNSARYLKSYSVQLLKAENDAEYSSVQETVRNDGNLIWLSGYIPEAETERFEEVARERNWAWLISDIEDGDVLVPTKIRYGKLTALIKPIFDILGVVPGYREYDISFWFLAFFTLFFAMIIGDAGYGVVFLLGTVIFSLKSKKVTNIALLLYILSFGTIAWGAVTGTWFGLESAMEVPILKALVIPSIANYPEYFNVGSNDVQNNVMKFCFSIGVIQLALACVMNIRRKLWGRNLSWLSDVGWLLSISALYFIVLNLVTGESVNLAVAGLIVGIGFVLVILFGGMEPGKTFTQGLKAGLGNIFTVFLDTISAFGNLMSYIRLFAVGMASLAIAQSFNDMAAGFSGPLVIVGFVIMAVGHILNIVMGFLSVVVHGVRLNLLEFSGQLGMEWSGVAYEPFRKIKNNNK